MNKVSILVVCLSLVFSDRVSGQELTVLFKSGEKSFSDNFETFIEEPQVSSTEIIDGYYHRYVQFDQIPSFSEQEELKRLGLKLVEYLPHNTYLIAFPQSFNFSQLSTFQGRSVFKPDVEDKLDVRILERSWPAYADDGQNLKVSIVSHKTTSPAIFLKMLEREGISVDKNNFHFPEAYVSLPKSSISSIAQLPFVYFIDLGGDPGEPEDTGGRTLQRANVIDNLLSGGRRYDGSGVGIQVRDDGLVGPHIDFQGRVFDFTGGNDGGTHGDGVAGVFAGAGNLDPTVQGGAKGADVYVTNYESSFTDNTIDLHQINGVKVTNSSYSNGCNAGYTTTTQRVDQQIIDNPTLMHIFSAGNSNGLDCGYGAGTQWGNITGGHKQGKNVIAVANLFASGNLVSTSSRGPAHDGRIKPDISAHGQGEVSTGPDNNYLTFGGTSSSAPTMAGSYTQLYQAYRELNGGSDPNTGFLKAVVLNSAFDMGNRGPDFKFGWGRIDAYQGLMILENNQYTSGSAVQGQVRNHAVEVPPGVAEVRFMVYWNDVPGAVSTNRALVNDLNLIVLEPDNTVHNPWVLDPTPDPANLDLPATTGVDNLNNMEQVSILNPQDDSYTVRITGDAVPMGSQDYFVVWSFIYDEIKVTYPLGGEGFVPGETERLHWDAYGTTETFHIEYSTNDGQNWNTIANSVSASTRSWNWTVPGSLTDKALIRVNRGAQSDISDENFSIIGLPQNITVSESCQTGATITWDAVAGADEYNVYILGEQYMDLVSTTTQREYSFENLPPNETSWFSVQAVINGRNGRRANAISYSADPGDPNCRNTISFEKTATVSSANAGDTITYSLTLTSFYDNTINNIVITDLLDPTWLYIDGSLSCNGTVNNGVITIDSSSLDSDQSITCSFQVRSDILEFSSDIFEDDIESGAGNWTVDNIDGAGTWSVQTDEFSSPINAWFTPNTGSENNLQALALDPIFIREGGMLSFDHFYNTEVNWDGGMVEVSVDDGQSWADLGPMMTQNGYNGGLGFASNAAIANRSAFTGSSNGFITTEVDLSAFANNTIIIRFLFGQDNNTFEEGWYIDDIVISEIFNMTNSACVSFDEDEDECSESKVLMLECQQNCDSCTDGVLNGDEAAIDCGGTLCDSCPCTQDTISLVYDNTALVDGTTEWIEISIETTGATSTMPNAIIDLRAGSRFEISGAFETGDHTDLSVYILPCEINP